MPWLLAEFDQEVPPAFWAEETVEDREVIVVSCPCEHEAVVPLGSVEECECGRFYLAVSGRVRVARPEDVQAGLPPAQGVADEEFAGEPPG